MSFSNVFDPVCVKANLKLCLKGREQGKDHKNSNQWLVNWENWTDKSISSTVEKWKNAGSVQSEEQLRFTAYVVAYVEILHRAILGHNSTPNPLPKSFPLFGPMFYPPTVEYREAWLQTSVASATPFEVVDDQNHLCKTSPLSNPAQFLIEPVYVLSPVFEPHLGLDKCQVPGCNGNISKRGFIPTGPRSCYGISSNIKVIGLEYICSIHRVFSNTSHDRFWNYLQPWQCGNTPHFQERSAGTRELFQLITEFRPHLSIGELVEHFRQLHILHNRQLENSWLAAALREKERNPDREVKLLPTTILRTDTGVSKEFNEAPSAAFIRSVCEFFIDQQRREESARYLRTLAGVSIGLDATIKIAKKANVYVKTTESGQGGSKPLNVFEGGLLTGVNEDKELVICEFLGTSAYVEMNPPVREFADRCDTLGVGFRKTGKICVDRCCDFRKTLQIAVPGITITQDLAHIKVRIMETIPKKSLYRDLLSRDISDALICRYSSKKGDPPLYRPKEEQASRLRAVWEKYSCFDNVWTSESQAIFDRQVRHAENGCLQNDDPTQMSTTSINENWHKRLNRLSIGRTGSVTIIEGLVMDAILRFNLMVKIDNRSQPMHSLSRLFRLQTDGSHHLYLLENILQQREKLTGISQPHFLNIKPEHRFGLVTRESGSISVRYANLCENVRCDFKTEEDSSSGMIIEENEDEILFSKSNDNDTDAAVSPSIGGKRKITNLDDGDIAGFPNKARLLNNGGLEKSSLLPLDADIPMNQLNVEERYSDFEGSAHPSSDPLDPPLSPHPTSLYTFPPPSSPMNFLAPLPDPPLSSSSLLSSSTYDSTPAIDQSLLEAPSRPLLPAPPFPFPVASNMVELTTASTLSIPKQTRTEQTLFKLTGRNISAENLQKKFPQNSDGYWRCCALRMQDHWISTMSDKDWVKACDRYNDPLTPIDSSYYRKQFPHDSVRRDPVSLKKFCIDFEETCRQWKAKSDVNKDVDLSTWKKMHLALPIPERLTTKSVQNRYTKAKICGRCCKVKDGMGVGKGHQRDCCDDGFPIWKHVPYPLPMYMASLQKGRSVVSADVCFAKFRELAKELETVNGNLSALNQQMQNTDTFEKLTRQQTIRSLHEALILGPAAYCFDRDYVEKKKSKLV